MRGGARLLIRVECGAKICGLKRVWPEGLPEEAGGDVGHVKVDFSSQLVNDARDDVLYIRFDFASFVDAFTRRHGSRSRNGEHQTGTGSYLVTIEKTTNCYCAISYQDDVIVTKTNIYIDTSSKMFERD
jgi:hypothetical protein